VQLISQSGNTTYCLLTNKDWAQLLVTVGCRLGKSVFLVGQRCRPKMMCLVICNINFWHKIMIFYTCTTISACYCTVPIKINPDNLTSWSVMVSGHFYWVTITAKFPTLLFKSFPSHPKHVAILLQVWNWLALKYCAVVKWGFELFQFNVCEKAEISVLYVTQSEILPTPFCASTCNQGKFSHDWTIMLHLHLVFTHLKR